MAPAGRRCSCRSPDLNARRGPPSTVPIGLSRRRRRRKRTIPSASGAVTASERPESRPTTPQTQTSRCRRRRRRRRWCGADGRGANPLATMSPGRGSRRRRRCRPTGGAATAGPRGSRRRAWASPSGRAPPTRRCAASAGPAARPAAAAAPRTASRCRLRRSWRAPIGTHSSVACVVHF